MGRNRRWNRKVAPCGKCGELVSAREIAGLKCDACGKVPDDAYKPAKEKKGVAVPDAATS